MKHFQKLVFFFLYFEFMEFVEEVEQYGVVGSEYLAMEMKKRGIYMAHQLSFTDVTFEVGVGVHESSP